MRKQIGRGAVVSIVVGSVIGSGIFILPGLMTAQLPSPPWVVAAFVAGGLLSLFGALTLAELGGMFPDEGGQYVYLRETVGKGWAFLFGWASFWLIQTGIIAAVSLAFGRFAGLVFGYDDAVTTAFVAVAAIAALTAINALGIRQGTAVQNLLTVVKVAGILVLVALAFFAGAPEHGWLSPAMPDAAGWDFVTLFGLAALAGIFAYDGWYVVTYVAGEVRDPQRSIPLGLTLGMVGVVVVYLITILAYFWVLSAAEVSAIGTDGNSRIAADVAAAVIGPAGALLLAGLVMLSTLGAVNGQVLTGPRLFAALARDGMFWNAMGRRRGKRRSPVTALVFQGEWAAFLVLLSIFATDAYLAIVSAVVFGIWLFFIPTTVGYFRMRWREPGRPRPYRAWGHPVVPGLFLLAAASIVVNAIAHDVRLLVADGWGGLPDLPSLWALLLILVGVPLLARGRTRKDTPVPA